MTPNRKPRKPVGGVPMTARILTPAEAEATCPVCHEPDCICRELTAEGEVVRGVVDKLRSEVARLRAALERIRAVHATGASAIENTHAMDDIARAALGRTTP